MEVPDWKVYLLERKRKDEEEMKRREREEEDRLAKMPAWKREIILRRKAKAEASMLENKLEMEAGEEEEREKVGGGGGATEEKESRVLRENIGPVQQNPFIQQEKQRKIPEYSSTRSKPSIEQTVHRIARVEDIVRDPHPPNEVKEQQGPPEDHQSPSVEGKGRVSRLLSRFGGSRTEDENSDPCLQWINGEVDGTTKTLLSTPHVVVDSENQASSSVANPTPPPPSCLQAATGSQALTQETTLSSHVPSSSSCVDSEPVELSTCMAPTAMSGFSIRPRLLEEVRSFPFQLRPASPARNLKLTTQVSPAATKPETYKLSTGKTEDDGQRGLSPSRVNCNFQNIKKGTGENQAVQRRIGNTITVNPRKVAVCENGFGATETKSPATRPESGKKRYPTVDEIKVIGGYLALSRSCMAKHTRDKKKLNISFPEAELERTFEYPSESSLLAEYGPSEEPDTSFPSLSQSEDDEEEESALLEGILRRKALIVDESCKR
ncbi:phostensin [Pseudophryne corroboree]|uniref:phostensin n=1 Tax=Pseudophryne corroboree TaxID=495146 RepID=UPI0030817D63